ncbi:Uncharacterised protein [Mycobacteroides abscessus subsp. abscessus]|nr:Uncharacterised protein [Mycobacteroides abscessus subsp. abscessus]
MLPIQGEPSSHSLMPIWRNMSSPLSSGQLARPSAVDIS